MYFIVVAGGGGMHHCSTHAKVRGQLSGVTSHLPPVGAENQSQVWSSGLMTSIFFSPLNYLLVLLFYFSEGLLGIELKPILELHQSLIS